MFPDYVVKTAEPWRLAALAAITAWELDFHDWARENVDIDGEAEYTIYATFVESPETQAERSALVARADDLRIEANETDNEAQRVALLEKAGEIEAEVEEYGCGYAEYCIEVFLWEGDLPSCPIYESLDECFGEAIKLVEPETV